VNKVKDIQVCPKCGKEIPQKTNYCPSCGSSLQTNTIMLQEKIVEARHKETEAFVGCILGVVVFLMGFVIRLPSSSPIAGFINFLFIILGIVMMIIMAVFSQHYSNRRKNLLKGL
jgi:uncharacterized membrane protein YvbJ